MENQSSSAALPNSSLSQTWHEFLHALKRSREPFNPWWWIYRLAVAAVHEYVRLPPSLTVLCRRLAPILALTLINLVGSSYFGVMRQGLIQKRWCPAASSACAWLYAHDGMVSYLWFMIMFHFVQAAYGSPGIVLTASNAESQTWIDAEKEKERLTWYETELANKLTEAKKTVDPSTLQPSPDPSWCKRCAVTRPPRCHHCRTCGVCVLEFDHHCICLNNCIGYYNYRSFLLTVFFLTVSCWYGVLALYVPFYEPLQEILHAHGGFIPYLTSVWKGDQPFVTYDSDLQQYSRGLLHLPSMDTILSSLWDDSEYRVRVLMEALFPLILSVGALLSGFLGMHVKWTTQGLTSLDYRARNATQVPHDSNQSQKSEGPTSLWQLLQNNTRKTMTNPFDRGTPYLNWVHRMGSNPFLLFTPLSPAPLPQKVKQG